MWLKFKFSAPIKGHFQYILVSPCRNNSTYFSLAPFQGKIRLGQMASQVPLISQECSVAFYY
uniref:Uncharacterized protein n=1 Tax=Anguilla anguilla TaxID=7936 RepID=A0A0E9WP65_ANGAN